MSEQQAKARARVRQAIRANIKAAVKADLKTLHAALERSGAPRDVRQLVQVVVQDEELAAAVSFKRLAEHSEYDGSEAMEPGKGTALGTRVGHALGTALGAHLETR